MKTDTTEERMIESVEAVLAAGFPGVELVDLKVRGGRGATVTIFIDRAGGVDLELCSAVAAGLDEVRESYALEVSSPGLDRPLRTPAHFAAATGRRVVIKTADPRDGRSVFRGTLNGVSSKACDVSLDDGGAVDLRYDEIARAHVIFEPDQTGGQRE